MTSANAAVTSSLEEADVAVDLFDRDLGEDARRVVEVLAALVQDRRHLRFAGDQRLQPVGRRRELPLHDHVGRARDAAAVDVGVLRPLADHVVGEDAGGHRADQLLVVELPVERQRRDVDRVQPVQEPGQRRALIGDGLRGRVVHFRVVLVDAEVGGAARMALEVVLDDFGGQGRKRGIAGSAWGAAAGGAGPQAAVSTIVSRMARRPVMFF